MDGEEGPVLVILFQNKLIRLAGDLLGRWGVETSQPSRSARKDRVCRISVSLPEDTYEQLESLVVSRGFESRSQAIAEMVNQSALDEAEELGDEVMAGTITIFYHEAKGTLLRDLAAIEREHIDEVISSQHVLLEDDHVMEVVIVQGSARKLKKICNRFRACKGVRAGRLSLSSMIMPPLKTRAKPGDGGGIF